MIIKKNKNLLMGICLIALSILYSSISSAHDLTTNQSGNCSSLTTATCYSHDGITPVTSPADIATYCLNNGALYNPAGSAHSANSDPRGQTCTYTCFATTHLSHSHNSDDDGTCPGCYVRLGADGITAGVSGGISAHGDISEPPGGYRTISADEEGIFIDKPSSNGNKGITINSPTGETPTISITSPE